MFPTDTNIVEQSLAHLAIDAYTNSMMCSWACMYIHMYMYSTCIQVYHLHACMYARATYMYV